MKQQIIQKALINITSIKNKNMLEYEAQMQELRKNDEYVKLEKEYSKAVIENARKESYGEKIDIGNLKNLAEQLESIKKSLGFENVERQYKCNACHDDGYINGQMCNCLKKEISKLLLNESGFEKLEDFDS